MRSIDPVIKARLLQMQQTLYSNAQPAMDVHAIRPRTPIFHKRFWEESIITPDITATSTSVAIRKTGTTADRAYVAYVSNGILRVKSAAITFPVSQMIWQIELSISNCMACALEFDGYFFRATYNKVEFRTDPLPWLFYVTTDGQLLGGILGSDFAVIVGANVTSLDVVRGVTSEYKDIDQGLLVFYTYGGAVYYNSLLSGNWQGQQMVDIGPTNAVSIKCERLFDYRIVLQITDAAGVLWEVFSKMYVSGWHGNEKLTAALGMSLFVTQITYIDRKDDEEIAADLNMTLVTLYALSPVMIHAENYANTDSDFGYQIRLTFDELVFHTVDNEYQFVLTDAYNSVWHAEAISNTGRELFLTFGNFNNASNPVVLSYTPGTVTGEVSNLQADSISFSLTGLVPYFVEPAVVTNIENVIDWMEVP